MTSFLAFLVLYVCFPLLLFTHLPSSSARSVLEGTRRELATAKKVTQVSTDLVPGEPTTTYSPTNNGGRIISAASKVHIIWYGPKWTDKKKAIITDFINSFGKTATTGNGVPDVKTWWKTMAEFKDKSNTKSCTAAVTLGTQVSDTGSKGTFVTDDEIQALWEGVFAGKTIPLNTNDIYALLLSEDVGFADYCHDGGTCSEHGNNYYQMSTKSAYVDYAYITSAAPNKTCQTYCSNMFTPLDAGYGFTAPNDASIDGLISNLAHEMAEVVSDPDGDAWYQIVDGYEYELADQCFFAYNPVYTTNPQASSQTIFNVYGTNGRSFLIQQLYSKKKAACVMKT
eukprot:TRINITY_DN7565_c0_g1_i1.p1 TRINITY_DN7565_c0_g1~~TRINITY_DN7565_c0_g1_i1.p1  ORF type:complete len:340 (-),score=40.53 TRINITY_DN7565_c0_g1_i1:827-1846(-)